MGKYERVIFMDLCLRFHESAIGYWASRYLDSQSFRDQENEKRLMGLEKRIQKNKEMTRKEFCDIQKWKSTQGLWYLKDYPDAKIRQLTKNAFAARDDWDKLDILMEPKGVAYPRASVILHFYDRCDFPLVDEYAVWAVDKNNLVKTYTKDFWLAYVRFCRGMARRNGFCMRTIDRALWAFGWYYSDSDGIS